MLSVFHAIYWQPDVHFDGKVFGSCFEVLDSGPGSFGEQPLGHVIEGATQLGQSLGTVDRVTDNILTLNDLNRFLFVSEARCFQKLLDSLFGILTPRGIKKQ